MNKVNLSEVNSSGDLSKYPDDTLFVWDGTEKTMKIPESIDNKQIKNTIAKQD